MMGGDENENGELLGAMVRKLRDVSLYLGH